MLMSIPGTIFESMKIWRSHKKCPNGYCKGIGRETACGTPQTTEAQCVSYGCAWCAEPDKEQKCVHVVLGWSMNKNKSILNKIN